MTAADADGVVLFDMDGVLVRGRSSDPVVHERALDDALAEYGLAVDEARRDALADYAYGKRFADACRTVGVDPVTFYAVRETYSARRTADRLRAEVRGLHDNVGALDRLADRYRLGVVSNNYHRAVTAVVEHHGLDAFSVVRGRTPGLQGYRRRKPSPHYLSRALDALGADDGVYVGDRETDLLAADRAGIDAALVRRDHNADATMASTPTYEVDSLSELCDVL